MQIQKHIEKTGTDCVFGLLNVVLEDIGEHGEVHSSGTNIGSNGE